MEQKKHSRTTRFLTQALAARDFPTHVRGHEMNPKTQEFEPTTICMADVIERVLEGKIISKSEVDSLRRENKRLQDAYNYIKKQTGDEYDIVRRENEKLKKEIQYITNLAFDSLAMQVTPPFILPRPNIFEPDPATKESASPWWKFWV